MSQQTGFWSLSHMRDFLTLLCRMDFPILINWTSPFPFLGLLGGIFHFYSNFKRNFCLAASDLVLHCLPMSHKKDTRPIWLKAA